DEILMVVNMLPDQASPYLRDAQAASFGQEQLLGAIQNTPVTPYEFTWDDWQGELSTPLRNLVLDNIYGDEEIPGQPYDFESDDRLTTKAKELLRRNVIQFSKEQAGPTLEDVPGRMFT